MSSRMKSAVGRESGRASSKPRNAGRRKDPVRRGPPADAASMLMDDHRAIDALFAEALQGGAEDDQLLAVVDEICERLALHAALEEEIAYPAFARVLDDPIGALIEAEIEHDLAKRLVAELRTLSADDDRLLPTLRVLRVGVRHHVHEEETILLPAARRSGIDLVALGAEIAARRAVLELPAQGEPASPTDPAVRQPARGG